MEEFYTKLSLEQKSALPANALFWKREQKKETIRISVKSKFNKSVFPLRILFYKSNIKDY